MFMDNQGIYSLILFIKVLINLLAGTDFSLKFLHKYFYIIILQPQVHWSLSRFTASHILLRLRILLVIVIIPFLPFKGTTHVYLLKTLMMNTKNENTWLILLINCISAT